MLELLIKLKLCEISNVKFLFKLILNKKRMIIHLTPGEIQLYCILKNIFSMQML